MLARGGRNSPTVQSTSPYLTNANPVSLSRQERQRQGARDPHTRPWQTNVELQLIKMKSEPINTNNKVKGKKGGRAAKKGSKDAGGGGNANGAARVKTGESVQDYLNRRFTEMTLMQINTVHWESMPRREREKAQENPLERRPMAT